MTITSEQQTKTIRNRLFRHLFSCAKSKLPKNLQHHLEGKQRPNIFTLRLVQHRRICSLLHKELIAFLFSWLARNKRSADFSDISERKLHTNIDSECKSVTTSEVGRFGRFAVMGIAGF